MFLKILIGIVISISLFYIIRYLLLGGNHGLIARRIIKSYNVFRNYYKKGEESDIPIVLEISVVF